MPIAGPVQRYQYRYDSLYTVLSVTDPLGNVTEAAGGQVIAADPDDGGPLESPVSTYVAKVLGQIVAEIDALGRVVSYSRDELGRVTEVTLPDVGQRASDLEFDVENTKRVCRSVGIRTRSRKRAEHSFSCDRVGSCHG